MKVLQKLISIAIIAALVFSGAAYVLAETEAEQEPGNENAAEAAETEKLPDPSSVGGLTAEGEPNINIPAALVYCRNTGEIVFSKAGNQKFSPYGIAKLFTAYLAVQKLKPDQEVTVSYAAASAGEPNMGLKEGETVTVDELLYGAVMMAGNDAAIALAEATSGSEAEFVDLMNQTLSNIGCFNTRFVSPSGSINDISKQYSTPSDILEIAKLALSNASLKHIMGITKYEVPETDKSPAKTIETKNPILLSEKRGYKAAYIGRWNENRSAAIANYEDESLELIVVLMGSASNVIEQNCDALIQYAVKNISGIEVVKAGENVGKARVKHGAETTIDVYTATDCIAYLPKEGSKELIKQVVSIDQDLEAPLKKGTKIGTLQIFVADEKVNEVDLVAEEDVNVGWFPSYIGISNKATVIIAAVLFLILLLIIVRIVNKIKSKLRRRRAKKAKIRAIALKMLEEEERARRKRR